MRIVNRAKVEDRFDGSSVYEYEFDEAWSLSMIRLLKALGELEYLTDFARPLFRVTSNDGSLIKGVEGDPACRVIYPRVGSGAAQQRFEGQFDR